MFKKILIFIITGTLIFIISGCEGNGEESGEIPKEGTYVRCVEVNERETYDIANGSIVWVGEDLLFEESDLIFKGKVLDDATEIAIEYYIDGKLYYVYYEDIFTFEVEKIYYSESSSLGAGDIIRVSNSSCPSYWITGTIRMEKGKSYIVLTGKVTDYPDIEFTKYSDYFTKDPWVSIVLVEDGKYYVDEELPSLTNNAEEEIIRKDGDFKTTLYVKGSGFEDELEALILEKKGES